MSTFLETVRQIATGESTGGFSVLLRHAAFAAMGGLVRELVSDGQHSFVKFVAGAVVGVFCGLIVYFLCKHFGLAEYGTAAFTGLGGYIGVPILDLAGAKLRKWLGKD